MRCMAEPVAESIAVEVVVQTKTGPQVLRLSLPVGAVVADACVAAARELSLSEQSWLSEPGRLGILGQKVAASLPLEQGDRVEVYRPITCDPKARRRARAGQA